MAGLGDIVTSITVRPDGVASGLNSFERQMERSLKRVPQYAMESARQTNAAMSSMGRGGRFGFGLLELSRGVEDFAVSASLGQNRLQALSMGFRGAGNNIAAFATVFNPLAGAIAGFAVAGVSALLSYFSRQEVEAKEAKDALADYRKELDLLTSSAARSARFRFDISTITESGSARSRLGGIQSESRGKGAEIESLMSEIGQFNTQIMKAKSAWTGTWEENERRLKFISDIEEKRNLVEEQLTAAYREQSVLIDEQVRLKKKLGELTAKEKQDEADKAGRAFLKSIDEERKRLAKEQRADSAFGLGIVDDAIRRADPKRFREIQAERRRAAIEGMNLPGDVKQGLIDIINGGMEGGVKLGPLPTTAGLQQGSSAALSAIYQAQQNSPQAKVAQQSLNVLEKIRGALEKMAEDAKDPKFNVVSIPP